jgi:hypothetical protein
MGGNRDSDPGEAEMTTLASAANARYGYHLLNMLGSVERNSAVFDRIVVYDLGLDDTQRRLVGGLRNVELRTVPAFAPHWAKCFSWKPWIWTHLEVDSIFYLDAGATILRPLHDVVAAIDNDGYFIVGQGIELGAIVPDDYYDLYGLPRAAAVREYVAAGIIGFRTTGDFFRNVLTPTYEDVLLGRNLGFSRDEIDKLNWGDTKLDEPIVRDCAHFRHDQTLLNIHLALAFPNARVHDLWKYGGWRSANDHPEQVIWNHRRASDWRYVAAADYAFPAGLLARRARARLRLGGWKMRNARFLRPSAYWTRATRALRQSQR